MNKNRQLVEQAITNASPSSNGWWRVNCPVCPIRKGSEDKKKSLRFKPEYNGFYDCMRCHIKGRLHGDFYDYIENNPYKEEENKPIEIKDPPEGFMFLSEEPAVSASITQSARDYLISRNVMPKVWKRMLIGITFEGSFQDKDRIIIPVIIENEWYGWSGRVWEESPYRLTYKNAVNMHRGDILWNQDFLDVETDDPVVVVEGVFDGLPHIFDIDVVAFLGKPSKNHFALLRQSKRPVVIALDGDSWHEARALAMKLEHKGVQSDFLKFPPKKDPGKLKPGRLGEMARNAISS